MVSISIEAGDIIAGLALLLSAYAMWVTTRFNGRQKALIESQERLNNILLDKETNDSLAVKKADLGATFIRLGTNQHRLKIWNKGKASARYVRLEFPEGNDVLIESELETKFPLESLDCFQSVELIAAVHMGSKRKQVIKLLWDDDFQTGNEKLVYPTL